MGEYPILKFFSYEHLPQNLQAISKPFCDLAHVVAKYQDNDFAEKSTVLRKLLEAKDAAVRCHV